MPKLSLATVQKRIAALQKTAETLKKKDKQPAVKAILALMAKHDVSLGELRAALEGGATRKTRVKKPVAAKFKDPQSGKTWSGRGRTPGWLSEAEAAAAASPGSEALALTVSATRGEVEVRERRLAALTGTGADATRPDGLTPGSWQAELADAVQDDRVQVRGDSKWVEKVKHKLSNPDLLLYKIQQTAYKFSFLLIPLSIPFVALLFLWRRGFTLYDHGVFVLYSLTAMSILVMVTSILAPIWSGFGVLSGLAFAFGVPAHMFAQLKGAYQLSWFSAAWRTMLLLIFCVFALTAFVLSIIMLGLAG